MKKYILFTLLLFFFLLCGCTRSAAEHAAAGRKLLGEAGAYLRELSPARKKINHYHSVQRKYNELVHKADNSFKQAFTKNPDMQFAFQTAMRYYALTNKYISQDFCLQWLARCSRATNYRPDFLLNKLDNTASIKKRYFLINAMGLTGDTNYLDTLYDIVTNRVIGKKLHVSKETDVSYAISALGEIRHPASTNILLDIYNNPEELVGFRVFAAEALENLTGRQYEIDISRIGSRPGQP